MVFLLLFNGELLKREVITETKPNWDEKLKMFEKSEQKKITHTHRNRYAKKDNRDY
jgi:hypothetical protein